MDGVAILIRTECDRRLLGSHRVFDKPDLRRYSLCCTLYHLQYE